ncbi:murein hydrolase activator EnvC family protein [Aliivibrio fischeri]|uniref:murein hydrolase activator EnvC family protein n=1 Tax=Aliivibrio fischeri TaxID=668 RepID=UPI001F2280AD|nr:peptidoglycan DD-metalloendopeptidase family protein [Aliivibrio fischeri]MCE7556772.1 peptidoglycan DD-metalloendopeptidase family protein [Aliivibrio fischeri]MCE7564195.1 peptidoglycan DD-metalloendopeptidase family protein [Aliivibrio fischeri]MCE7571638.1 peptidoglycan DD-metalloendopeptidase family protein [Aliivibrio fischeri]
MNISLLNNSFFCRRLATTALVCLAFSSPILVHASDAELKGMKQEISRQNTVLSKQKKELSSLQNSLKKHEVSIANASKKIRNAEQELTTLKSSISSLKQQQSELTQQQIGQTEILKDLLVNYYLTSRNNQLSNVLSGDDVTKMDRMTQYAQRISEARVGAISQLEFTNMQLEEKEAALLEKQQRQSELLAQYKKEKVTLQTSQNKRKKTVSSIRKRITNESSYLNELQQNEKRLKTAIAKAKAKNNVPMDGIGRQKGRLPWPISNPKTLHSFGTKQTGQLTWKGMVLAGDYGTPVKAVYSGKVVFADWLRGYGLMVLIDHGKGDMTLYGYNQSLMKKEGDKVRAGETIAVVGDSGGQDRPSLYFEIRRNSKAQNPRSWLRR